MNKKIRHSNLLLLLAVLLIGFLIYSALFRLDNKYTASLPGGYGYNVLQNNPDQIAFLVDGWEYYPGQWLNPEDFNQGVTPTTYTYIGQYPNFSAHLNHPYGTATYRILLQNDHPSIDLALYLPELLCAGRVYINGILVGEQGSLSPYTPQVIDSIYSFTATGNTEIIIQCANYTHYYSGLYYPPAVGTSKAIFQMLTIRMAVYGILCFVPLAIALFNLALWVLNRDMLTRWMGLLCLFFSLRMSYPFFHALGISYIRLLYALEDLCGNLVLLCAIMLAGKLAGTVNLWYHRYVAVPAAASLCIIAVLFPLFILPYAPLFINIYGFLLFIWKLLTGLYLLFLAGHALQKDQALGRYLLCAAGFYGLSIAASVLTVNYFEPICGAWLEEYGGFALVVGFAALMALRGVMLARENKKLTLHLQNEVDRKTHGMEILLSERRELLAHLLHDLKNPLAALRSYAELVRLGGVALDQETAGYLDALTERAEVVGERFDLLQDFSRGERGMFYAEEICLNTLLQQFHSNNRLDIEMSGLTFHLKLPKQDVIVRGNKDRLERALENLCYNALSFTHENGTITLSLEQEEHYAVISVQDTGAGIHPQDLPYIFKRGFTRRSDGSNGEGLGLFIVRTIALEHNGSVDVVSQLGHGSVFTLRLPSIVKE